MKRTHFFSQTTALLCAGALALTLAGCGSSSSYSASSIAMESSADLSYEAEPTEAATGTGMNSPTDLDDSQIQATAGRKIVYNAWLQLESTQFDQAQSALTQAVADAGGYLESSNLGGSAEWQSRWAEYTARIPAEQYRSFLLAAGEAASVLSQSEEAQDITSTYVDVEARLKTLENQRDRLNELAEKAETTADLLEIESQLSDVQYQIESYTSRMRVMDDQVSYSTVTISLSEVAVLTPMDDSFSSRIGRAFTDGWSDFADSCEDFVVAVVYLLPVLLLAAVAFAAGAKLVRRRRARRAAKRLSVGKEPSAPPENKDDANTVKD